MNYPLSEKLKKEHFFFLDKYELYNSNINGIKSSWY